MPNVRDILGKENYVYVNSLAPKELEKSVKALNDLLKEPWLNDANKDDAAALVYRVATKMLALRYFCEGYDEKDFSALNAYVKKAVPVAEKYGYKNTLNVMNNVVALAGTVNSVMGDAAAIADRVRDYDWNPVALSAEECAEVAGIFDKKAETLRKTQPVANPFGDKVKAPDFLSDAVKELEHVRDFALQCEKEYLRKADDETFNASVQDASDLLKNEYGYFQTFDAGNRTVANVQVLCTPFFDEAELFVAAHSSSNDTLVRVFAGDLELLSANRLKKLFGQLAERKCVCMIFGLTDYKNEKNENDVYDCILRFGKNGGKAYLVDTDGGRGVFNRALAYIGTQSDIGPADIGFVYLTMPLYTDVLEIFENKGMIGVAEEKAYTEIRENMPFMGFVGLNEAVRAFDKHSSWKTLAEGRSANNALHVAEYFKNLPSQTLLLDSGWGDFSDRIKAVKSPTLTFDYDDIKTRNPENIKKIMQAKLPVYAKCGMLSKYCLLGGTDKSVWRGFSREEMEERIEEATKLVMRALGVNLTPEVAVLDNLKEKSAGGLCYNGGKRIEYRYSCVKDYEWLADAICHECFHAFQHKVMYNVWCDWYWEEFGVTRGRIAEWIENNKCYFNISDNRKAYTVQVLECEARAFASDALRAADTFWHTLNID